MNKSLIASLLIFGAAPLFAAGTPNLTGNWSVHNSIAGNESDQECKFVQTENKLTGTCKGTEKDVKVTGSIDGKKVTWKYESEYNGSPITLTYAATLDDPGKITGNVDVDPFGVTGDFTATTSKKVDK